MAPTSRWRTPPAPPVHVSHRPHRPSTCHARDTQACGRVKNLALSAHVSTDDDEEPIRLLCFNLGVEDVHMLCADDLHARGGHLVFLNGVILGVHRRPQLLLDTTAESSAVTASSGTATRCFRRTAVVAGVRSCRRTGLSVNWLL